MAAAIKARLEAIQDMGKVHASLRYTKEPPDSQKFEELFAFDRRLNVWEITRTKITPIQVTTDGREILEWDVKIAFTMALQDVVTEGLMQAQLDRVIDDFRNGDHTLGGKIHTHSLPTATLPNLTEFYGLLCHLANLEFKIEVLA